MIATAACGRDHDARTDGARTAARAVEAPRLMPPVPTVSHFDVPLEYDFTDVLLRVEQAVPRSFGSLDERKQLGDDTHKHYAFAATRGAFTASARDSLIYLRTTLSYAVRVYYRTPLGPTISAGCGKDGEYPEITVELVAPLTLGPNWHLKSAARISYVAPASDSTSDRCRVSLLQLDMTDRVIEAATSALTAKLPDIDRRVARIDLTKKAKGWWGHLNRPIRLTDSVWLLLQPQQLRLMGVSGFDHTLIVQVGLDAYPVIRTGHKLYRTAPPLPPLASDSGATGFRLLIDGVLDYTTASNVLSDALRGKSITQGARTVTVQSVIASAEQGGRLALTVAFTGDASGTLRFVGTPTYDTTAGQIGVADLDYDLRTDSELINAYAWLRSEALLTFFRSQARVPIGPILDRTKGLIMKGLNRTIGGHLTLAARVDSLTVVDLAVTPRGVIIRARVAGDARGAVHTKKRPAEVR